VKGNKLEGTVCNRKVNEVRSRAVSSTNKEKINKRLGEIIQGLD